MNQFYAVVAKPKLFGQIEPNRANWFRQVFVYALPYPRGPNSPDDATCMSLVKLVFLASMRWELGVDFVKGGSQISATFFDQWWTIHGCNDAILSDLLENMDASELSTIRDIFSPEQLQRIDDFFNYREPDTVIADVNDAIRLAVWGSSACRNDMIESIVGRHAHGHHPGLLRLAVTALVDQALIEHEHVQTGWPGITDCDKLDRAFSTLNAAGILSRHHAPCCATCAAGAIAEEIALLTAEEKSVRGYTFYHEQDTEGAIKGRELYLSYGSCTEDAPSTISIANEVRQALEAQGLTVKWDGTIDSKIGVTIHWQWRRSNESSKFAGEPTVAVERCNRTCAVGKSTH